MKVLKLIGLSILGFLGIIVLATITALATLFTYFSLQMLIFGRGDYLLFVSSKINIIPVIMIMIFIVYIFMNLKEKLFKNKTQVTESTQDIDTIIDNSEILNDESLSKFDTYLIKLGMKLIELDDKMVVIFKIIKRSYIIALLIAIYVGMTSYAIIYTDSIKSSSPINPFGKIYSYNDIKGIDVGISKYKQSYSPSYKITLNDNKTIELFDGGSMDSKDLNPEDVLVNLDNVLKQQGVPKTIDKNDFHNFAKGLNSDYVKQVEKLFHN